VLRVMGMKTLAALLLVPLSACGGSTVIGATPYQLTYSRAGGVTGANEVSVVDSAARTLSYHATYASTVSPPFPEQQATLAQADVDTLTAAIEAANLEHAGGPYHCATCQDTLSYEAKLVIGGSTYDVHWEDDTDASLEAMGTTITELDAKDFPSSGL
jgi:hypothetical protein